jgi:hypothetical protein
MNWIKRLFGMCDRADAAAERIGVALEGLASDLEEVRERVRERFGLSMSEPPLLPAPAEEAEEPKRNGHKRRTSV